MLFVCLTHSYHDKIFLAFLQFRRGFVKCTNQPTNFGHFFFFVFFGGGGGGGGGGGYENVYH